MRSGENQTSFRPQDAMEFFHGADDVGKMLDHVYGAYGIERVIAEGIREMVQLAEHVGLGARIAVDPDGSWELVDAAAHVEHTWSGLLGRGHFFSVAGR